MLCEVNDLAGQHEVIAENLQSDVIREINYLVKDIKEERKKVFLWKHILRIFYTHLYDTICIYIYLTIYVKTNIVYSFL